MTPAENTNGSSGHESRGSCPVTGQSSGPLPGAATYVSTSATGHPPHVGDGVSGPLPALYGEEFAADPAPAYDALRAVGPVAWAEIAPSVNALVVTSHRAAVELLTDPATYSKDPSRWAALNEGAVPPDSPVLAMMTFPGVIYTDAARHARLRQAMDNCTGRINPHHLVEYTRRHTRDLITEVAPTGRVDLMTDVADVVPLRVFADLLGCPEHVSGRLVTACQGMINAGPQAAEAAADLAACLGELIDLKTREPGPDVTSWMLTHPAKLTVEEIVHQLVVFVGAGTIPTAAWIGHALRLLLTDDDYATDLTRGTVTVFRAMEKALWVASPMANFSVHYARHHTQLRGMEVPAGVPILISHAAVNQDPDLPADLGYDNRSHLAFSAGPHRCPADTEAAVIVQTAVETVLDQLWDIQLTNPESITNRPGPFHQCPAGMPATFRPKPTPGGTT